MRSERQRRSWNKLRKEVMKCHICGGKMKVSNTDLPFKTDRKTIVILKELPVIQCENCTEYLLDDKTMAKVESMLRNNSGTP